MPGVTKAKTFPVEFVEYEHLQNLCQMGRLALRVHGGGAWVQKVTRVQFDLVQPLCAPAFPITKSP